MSTKDTCTRCERVFPYPKLSFEVTREVERQWNSRICLDERVGAAFDQRIQVFSPSSPIEQAVTFLEKRIFPEMKDDATLFGKYNFIPHTLLLNYIFRKISLIFILNPELQTPSFFDGKTLKVIQDLRKCSFELRILSEVQKILKNVYFSADPTSCGPPTKDESVLSVFSLMTEANHSMLADRLIEAALVEIRKKYWAEGVEYFHARVDDYQKMILHASLPPLNNEALVLLRKGDKRAQNLALMRMLFLYTFGALRKSSFPLCFYDIREDILRIRKTYSERIAGALLSSLESVQAFEGEPKDCLVREHKRTLQELCQKRLSLEKKDPLDCFMLHEIDPQESLSITKRMKNLFLGRPEDGTTFFKDETSPLLPRKK